MSRELMSREDEKKSIYARATFSVEYFINLRCVLVPSLAPVGI